MFANTHLPGAALAGAALLMSACAPAGPLDVIAHRGASGHAPEHTFAAYDLALEMGADFIEQDLQMTRDGTLVVLHDEDLERTVRGPAADCTGLVRDKTLAQLQRCDVTSWWSEEHPGAFDREPIPTLDAVLSRYAGTARFYIETKQPDEAPGMEEALLEALAQHGLLPNSGDDRTVLVQSFSRAGLERMRSLNDDVPLIQLLGRDAATEALDRGFESIAAYAIGIGPSWGAVTPELVAAAHANGLLVHPYTLDEETDLRRAVDLGVDGIFTNYPDRLIALLSGTSR